MRGREEIITKFKQNIYTPGQISTSTRKLGSSIKVQVTHVTQLKVSREKNIVIFSFGLFYIKVEYVHDDMKLN